MKVKSKLLSGRAARRAHMAMRRKDEAGHGGGGGTQETQTNNTGGNSGGESGDSGGENNTGQDFDLEGFWSEEGESGESSSQGESAGDSNGSSSDGNQNNAFATQLNESIDNANFGDLVTPEIYEAMSSGDPKSFNEGLQVFGRQVMRQTLGNAVGVMRELQTRIMAQVDERLNSRITSDKNYSALEEAIPSALKPGMGPTIRNIYDRALTRTKGNPTAAINMTKEVLRLQAASFGDDLELSVAPRQSGDNFTPPKATNWLEELNGR